MPVISPILQIKQLFAIVAKDTLVTIFLICQIIFRIYLGERCDKCDINFWGNPLEIGGSCEVCLMFILLYALFYMRDIFIKYNFITNFQECDCNGNIERSIPDSCDAKTGDCLKCQHNTGGDQCEHCIDGYFGDARNKNCRRFCFFCININEVVT